MAYPFRLQRMLDLMVAKEKQRKQQVAEIQRRISSCDRDIESAEVQIQGLDTSPQTAEWIWVRSGQLETLVRRKKDLEVKRSGLRDFLQRRLRELEVLLQRRKSIEALKTRKEKEYRMAKAHAEQREQDDEVSVTRMRAVE